MVRSSRPTLTTLNAILNSRRITWRTMSRVHNANSKENWAGSEPTIHSYSRAICAPDSFGGRPGTGLATSASRPPSRNFASHPYTVLRCSPNAAATSSGCAPAWTCSTARSRSTSRVR